MTERKRALTWVSLLLLEKKGKSATASLDFLEERRVLYEEYLVPDGKSPLQSYNDHIRKTTPDKITQLISRDVPRNGILSDARSQEGMQRVLQVYASTNRTVGYVQGMNMICAVIYSVMLEEMPHEQAEALTYFCFFQLMVDLGDLFSDKMDDSAVGIHGVARSMLQVLEKEDLQLYRYLRRIGLMSESPFYVRWACLLFAAEFDTSSVLLIWDRFFRETPKHRMLPFFSAASLILLKPRILFRPAHDIALVLESISAYLDPEQVLSAAEKLLQRSEVKR